MRNPFYTVLFLSVFFAASPKGMTQDGLQLTLRGEEGTELLLSQNEPLLLSLTLTNKALQSDKLWNMAADREIKNLETLVLQGRISREEADKEKARLEKGKKVSPPIILGQETEPWTSGLQWIFKHTKTGQALNLPLRLLPNPSTPPVARLDGTGGLTVYFGVSDTLMMAVPAGAYELSVSLNGLSDLLRLTITPAIAPTENALRRKALYCWHAEQAICMEASANGILLKNPSSIDGLSLMGDAMVMKADYSRALGYYQQALTAYYNQNGKGAEPPEYLLGMIGMVKDRLGQ